MGDFSRDPKERLSDSLNKHYVGIRMQQGVPILDADLNIMDDLKRSVDEDRFHSVIGEGVPVGSDGFRILPIAGGGVNTILLESQSIINGLSSIRINLQASTAAGALGFDDKNYRATRYGSSPARITSNKTEPFLLIDGSTLVIQDNELDEITISFSISNFQDPSAATAQEITDIINSATGTNIAGVGKGNDFIIKGGGGTYATAGRILVDGKLVWNTSDIKYSEQPLYKNNKLSSKWDVSPIDELTTPQDDEICVVYLDVWNREVGSIEDNKLIDVKIGIETALRLRREWAVRVVREMDYPSILVEKSSDHSYYRLALLHRKSGIGGIDEDMITDERQTDVSFQREIAYRGTSDLVLVNTDKFKTMLAVLRDNIREFIVYLTTKFITPDSNYLAAEVAGIDALSAIANVAEHGIALINAKSLGTKSAFGFFKQLLESEKRFVDVWKNAVLPLEKAPSGKIYKNSFSEMITRIEEYLTGPAPGGFVTISDALERGNLFEAVSSQDKINTEFGQEIERPTGNLSLTYLGSLTPLIQRNQTFDLRYEVSGSVTPGDDIGVDVNIDPQWHTVLRNYDGTIPFALHLGPGEDDARFIVSVTPPDVDVAETTISLRIFAMKNSGGLQHVSTQKTLKIGDSPPSSEEGYIIKIISTNLAYVAGIFQVPTNLSLASMNLRFINNSYSAITVNFEYEPISPPGWTIISPGSSNLQNRTIQAGMDLDFGFGFIPPPTADNTLVFIFRARDADTNNVTTEIQITFKTVLPVGG